MSIADELAKLVALQKQGVLSEGEFETAKVRLLGPPTPSRLPVPPSVPSVQARAAPTTVPFAPINVAKKPRSTRSNWIVGILCVVVAVGIAIAIPVAIHDFKASQCASSGKDCPGIPGSGGVTLSQLESSVSSQVTGPAPSGFGVTGVSSVVCNPPTSWSPGQTFTCFVYNSSGTGLGEYTGTVEPSDSSGDQRWNGEWLPSGG
jgi:hypothetical protein